jgi:ATP-dependent helicase/nuclease subunit B
MGLNLITGPANSGKTTAAVEMLDRFSPLELARSVRYVVPTNEAARRVESLLMARRGTQGLLGNVVCTFFSFAEEFIVREGLSSRLISDVKKELTLRKLVREVAPAYLGRSAEAPGFIRALDGIIGELKVSLVDPQALRAAVEGSALSGASVEKITELCELYQRYQDDVLVANNFHDREGQMWRALEIAAAGGQLRALDTVVFDGFDRLNAVQRRFLEIAANHVPGVVFTLRRQEGRPEVFGPSEDTRRFALGLGAREIKLANPPALGPIDRLAAGFFGGGEPAAEGETGNQSVTIVQGCDPAMEVELAAEEIGRLISLGGLDCADILVTARDISRYSDRVADIFARHRIPLAEPKRPLAETALARMVVACLNVIREDWPRDEVVRLIKSELMTKNQTKACLVELKAKERALVGGRAQWLEPWGDDDKLLSFRLAVLRPVIDFARAVRTARSPAGMARAARQLADSFTWRVRDERCLAEDSAAHAALTKLLTELEEAAGLLGPMSASDFFHRLEEIIYLSDYEPFFAGESAVRLIPVTAIGGQRYRAVFVLGLLEKRFPRQPREEPFLRDRERAMLNRRLDGALEPRLGPGPAGERLYFYSAVAAAADRLYLCYPLTDEAAKDSLPSFYLDEVVRVLGDDIIHRRRDHAALVPAPEAVFGPNGLKRSVVYALAGWPASRAAGAARTYNALLAHYPGLFARVWRESAERPARLTDPLILADLAAPERRLRCTELEVYAACPFRHFCSYTLKLKSIREEADVLDFGSLLHEVLYTLWRELRAQLGDGLAPGRLDPERTVDQALGLLAERFAADTRLANMPPYERELEERFWKTVLARYVRCEIAKAVPGYAPAFFELEFGGPGIPGRARDERSTEAPLIIEGQGPPVALAGKMDRVDLSAAGALVIDYKSGAAPILKNFEERLKFQPLLYALALKEVFGVEPVGAEYRPLKQWGPDGLYRQSGAVTGRTRGRALGDEEFAAALESCARLVTDLAARLRAGRIEIEPQACEAYCAFAAVCRRDKDNLPVEPPVPAAVEGSGGGV